MRFYLDEVHAVQTLGGVPIKPTEPIFGLILINAFVGRGRRWASAPMLREDEHSNFLCCALAVEVGQCYHKSVYPHPSRPSALSCLNQWGNCGVAFVNARRACSPKKERRRFRDRQKFLFVVLVANFCNNPRYMCSPRHPPALSFSGACMHTRLFAFSLVYLQPHIAPWNARIVLSITKV